MVQGAGSLESPRRLAPSPRNFPSALSRDLRTADRASRPDRAFLLGPLRSSRGVAYTASPVRPPCRGPGHYSSHFSCIWLSYPSRSGFLHLGPASSALRRIFLLAAPAGGLACPAPLLVFLSSPSVLLDHVSAGRPSGANPAHPELAQPLPALWIIVASFVVPAPSSPSVYGICDREYHPLPSRMPAVFTR